MPTRANQDRTIRVPGCELCGRVAAPQRGGHDTECPLGTPAHKRGACKSGEVRYTYKQGSVQTPARTHEGT